VAKKSAKIYGFNINFGAAKSQKLAPLMHF
jgi:hypothetical protein